MEDHDQIIDGEVVEDSPAITDITVRPVGADGVTLLPVEQQKMVLAEYDARRNHFLAWLLEHLKKKVHYGYPDNREPRATENWQPKPSLYKAGALLLCDLLRLKATYNSDPEAWKMLGSIAGAFVRTCTLTAPDGCVLGEGTGICEVGEKKMGPNPAIKMADKRALVAAVINSIPGCGDLFTQDLEDLKPEPNPQPPADPNKPHAPTRTDLEQPDIFQSQEFQALINEWMVEYKVGEMTADIKRNFIAWSGNILKADMSKREAWSLDAVAVCREALK